MPPLGGHAPNQLNGTRVIHAEKQPITVSQGVAANRFFRRSSPKNGRTLTEGQFAILLILPALALFAVVILYPLANSMYIGLLDESLVRPGEEFVGLENLNGSSSVICGCC